jgi:cephalosporin-C deacetylase-like acetyl esterase
MASLQEQFKISMAESRAWHSVAPRRSIDTEVKPVRHKFALLPACLAMVAAAAGAQTAPLPANPASAQSSAPVSAAPAPASTGSMHQESWTALSIDRSGLPPMKFNAVMLGKYEQPDYVREIWRLQWRPGDPIDVYIVLPKGRTKWPVILYLYDYHFDTDRFRTDVWCKAATEGGFAAVGFSSALSLQRQHAPRPMKEWFVSELQEALATSTHDVQMLLNYLSTRSDVDVSQVGMYGQGSGGAIAVLAAAVDSRIVALDLLNPWGDWPDWLKGSAQIPDEERPTYLQPAFLQKVAGLDPVVYMPALKLKALRIQHIMDDTVTPPDAIRKIDAAAPHFAKVLHYPNTDAHMEAWRTDGLNGWLRAQLEPDAGHSSNGQ